MDRFVINKEGAKDGLRSGNLILGDRQIGKTEALMEVIHEDHKGEAVVVLPTDTLRDIFKDRYHKKYPDDPIPITDPPHIAGRGRSLPMYADVLSLFPEANRQHLEGQLRAAIW